MCNYRFEDLSDNIVGRIVISQRDVDDEWLWWSLGEDIPYINGKDADFIYGEHGKWYPMCVWVSDKVANDSTSHPFLFSTSLLLPKNWVIV